MLENKEIPQETKAVDIRSVDVKKVLLLKAKSFYLSKDVKG